ATLPTDAINSGYAVTPGGIYIFGGYDSNAVYAYTTCVPMQLEERLPASIEGMAWAVLNHAIYLIGGRDGGLKNQVLRFYWQSFPSNFTWHEDFEHGLAGYNITAEGNNYAEISDFGYCGDALHFYDRDVNGYCWIEMPNQHHRFFGTYSLRFALYLPDTNVHWPWVLVDGGVGFALDYNALFLVVSHTGATDQYAVYHKICNLAAGHWYLIEAHNDIQNDTMFVYIDGIKYGPFNMLHNWNAECHFWLGEDWIHKEANWGEFYIDEITVREYTSAKPRIDYLEASYVNGAYTAIYAVNTSIESVKISYESIGNARVYAGKDVTEKIEFENGKEYRTHWNNLYYTISLSTEDYTASPVVWNVRIECRVADTVIVWNGSSNAEVYGEGHIVLYGKPVLVNACGEYLAVRNWDGYV
ncbi:MAG: hypothetical protein ACPL1Y_07770, partial [Thermoplasmata archaeon]